MNCLYLDPLQVLAPSLLLVQRHVKGCQLLFTQNTIKSILKSYLSSKSCWAGKQMELPFSSVLSPSIVSSLPPQAHQMSAIKSLSFSNWNTTTHIYLSIHPLSKNPKLTFFLTHPWASTGLSKLLGSLTCKCTCNQSHITNACFHTYSMNPKPLSERVTPSKLAKDTNWSQVLSNVN